jgi:hypothetical protein
MGDKTMRRAMTARAAKQREPVGDAAWMGYRLTKPALR